MQNVIKKNLVEICFDHFDRVEAGDTCATCPSRAENREVCLAMARVLQATTKHHADEIVREELRRLTAMVRNNDEEETELGRRLTIIETKLDSGSKSLTTTITLIGLVCSIVFSLIGVALALLS